MLKNGCIRGNWNERHLLERRVAQYSKRMGVRSLVMAAQGSPSSNRSTLISSFSASSQGSVHLPLSVSEPLRSKLRASCTPCGSGPGDERLAPIRKIRENAKERNNVPVPAV